MKCAIKVQPLGELVSQLNDEQLERYIVRLAQFRLIVGRSPDYFEEKDIIRQVKREE